MCVCVCVCVCVRVCDCRRVTLARSVSWVKAASVPRIFVRAAAYFAAFVFIDAKNDRCFARVCLPLRSEGIAFLEMRACISRGPESHLPIVPLSRLQLQTSAWVLTKVA